MILRNKKTGEHGDYSIETGGDLLEVRNYYDDDEVYRYDSIAKFYKQWEDYKPVKPLIEDEKARKLVSEWAKLTQTIKILVVYRRLVSGAEITEFFSQEKRISLEYLGRFDELEDMEEYTIEELCGEEKECEN